MDIFMNEKMRAKVKVRNLKLIVKSLLKYSAPKTERFGPQAIINS